VDPGWSEIPNTQIDSVCACTNGFPEVCGQEGCSAITEDWNSAVFDTQRNRLIIWGGGHDGYYGNELYALDLNNLAMTRLTDPGLPVATSCVESIVNGTQPNSRHTNDGIVYLTHVDKMFVFGGVPACPGGGFTNDTWTFDFATNVWQRMNPTGPIPRARPAAAAYDPNTGKVFVHDGNALYAYTFSTDSYEWLSNNTIDELWRLTGIVDPVRKQLLFIGNGQVLRYDIAPGSNYVLGWHGGDTVYSLNLDTNVWTATTHTGGPGAAISTGTYDRWSYSTTSNAFVLVNRTDQNAFSFRLTLGIRPAPPTGLQVQ
jgi:hypothetical protein